MSRYSYGWRSVCRDEHTSCPTLKVNRDEGQVESAGMLRIRYERSKESGSLITSASSIDLRTLIRRVVPFFLIA